MGAFGVGAELERALGVDVVAYHQLLEPRSRARVRGEGGENERIRSEHAASFSHTRDLMLALLADLARGIRGPAVAAESVFTVERERRWGFVVEAYLADVAGR